LQLIDAVNDKHLWSKPFMKEINLDNIFDLQEEVALEVASELEVILASGEREQLGSIPTNNIEAYNFYLLGQDFMNALLYSKDINEKDQALFYAKRNFEKAIELDSAFADAYSILGSIFIINLYNKEAANNWDKASRYLDSGLVMLDKALHYDRDNTQALASKAAYFELKGMHEEANPIYETISKSGYLTFEFGVSRYNSIDDYYYTINNYIRYLRAKPKDIIVPPYLLRMMIVVFRKAGFPVLEKQLIDQLFSFNNDTLEYLNALVMYENWQGNYRAALNYGLRSLKLDSTDSFSHLVLAIHYTYLNDYINALKYAQNFDRINLRTNGELQPSTAAGYIYMKNGEEKKAESHLRESIPRWQKQIELNTHTAQAFYYLHELAGVYLTLGKKEKAMEYLKEMKDLKIVDRVQITILNNWPNFDIVRNEPDFKDVLEVLKVKYQKQHTRIEELLNREGMI
jgi:tetratricopeptide (TPR) repeat protein